MKLFYARLAVLSVGGALLTSQATAEEAPSIIEALKRGDTQLHLRARAEHVEQDNNLADATSTTLKTRLSYQSASYQGFGLSLSVDDTTEVDTVDYSDGVVNRDTSVIADPEVTEVNEAFVSYTRGSITAKYGRQRILLDNQRFLGGVGWRQDEQTYDGLSLASKPAEGLSLFAAYVTQVNRIFAEAADHNHETVLLNGGYQTPFGKATLYGYLIDNTSAPALSSNTVGLRWQGNVAPPLAYTLEYASQSDSADNPNNYRARYLLAEVAWTPTIGSTDITLTPGYEMLGSDDGTAFTTPLATLHAFQGWADGFLGTPENGIVDKYFALGSTLSGYTFKAAYHQFESDSQSLDYGSELNLSLSKTISAFNLTLKYADYSADDYWVDTTKLWLMASATF